MADEELEELRKSCNNPFWRLSPADQKIMHGIINKQGPTKPIDKELLVLFQTKDKEVK